MAFTRRDFIVRSAAAAVAAYPSANLAAKPKLSTGWYRNAIVIDGLSSLYDPYAPEDQMRLSDRVTAELKSTGVSAINITVGNVGNGEGLMDEMLKQLKQYSAAIAANPDFLMSVRTADDIAKAKKTGHLGLVYGTQDTSMIGTSLDRIAELKAKDVRIVQLTYNVRNLSGDGALEPANAGLSRLGIKTIARIESEKLLLDLSHGGARTMAEAISVAARPLSINHTGCRDVHDNPRNTYDTTLRALADKGGVAGIYFMPFLAPNSKPTRDDLIRHIEHAVNVCGEDHVSLGTDGNQLPIPINDETWKRAKEGYAFRSANGFAAPGEGPDILTLVMEYNALDRFQKLTDDLAARRWPEAKLDKLLGGNLMRLYREVWGS